MILLSQQVTFRWKSINVLQKLAMLTRKSADFHQFRVAQVLLKIDWADKLTVAQVDTRGKGYAPAT